MISYKFLAFDGKEYCGESHLSVRGIGGNDPVSIIYSALDPSANLPQRGFLFYSFE